MAEGRRPLAGMETMLQRCDRCGACLGVCPLYAVSGRETAAPRGRLAAARGLMESGLGSGRGLGEVFAFCLLCRACTERCPNQIPVAEIMIEARRRVAGKRRAKHRLIGGFFGSGWQGTLRRTALFPAASAGEGSVAYFQGCAMKLFFPAVARATAALLRNISAVAVPPAVCCGTPHLAYGMVDRARALARMNIEAFAGAARIVTDCAACGSSLKEYGRLLADDPRWAARAREFSRKVKGLSEYLAEAAYRPPDRLPVQVTYHDPCHLARGQGIKSQPRELLRRAADYVELPSAARCCGGAGTFYLDYPDAARAILAEKTADILRTGARIAVTECPACLMQLARGRAGGRFDVMHISQVLQLAGGR